MENGESESLSKDDTKNSTLIKSKVHRLFHISISQRQYSKRNSYGVQLQGQLSELGRVHTSV